MSNQSFSRKKEVTGVIFFAFAVILGASYYLPVSATGFLGDILRSVGMGFFGISSYAIPPLFIYAAVDFFLEKRENVTPVRVRHVLFSLLALSAIFPTFTISVPVIRDLCFDVTGNQPLATNALSLLFQSGKDTSLFLLPEGSIILPGGVIGGSISLGLSGFAGKTGALVLLFAFLLSQIVYIFNISLSKTATKTAAVIRQTTKKVRSGAETLIHTTKTYSNNEEPEEELFIEKQRGKQVTFFDLPNEEKSVTEEENEDISFSSSDEYFSESDEDDSYIENEEAMPMLSFGDDETEEEDPFSEVGERVRTDFISSPLEPIPPSPQNQDIPFFLRNVSTSLGEEKVAADQWINVQQEPEEKEEVVEPFFMPDVRRIGVDGKDAPESMEEEEEPEIFSNIQELEEDPSLEESFKKDSFVDTPSVVHTPAPPKVDVAPVAPIAHTPAPPKKIPFKVAPLNLLQPDMDESNNLTSKAMLTAQGQKLEETLASFGVVAKVVNITHGPSITRFELTPGPGIKVSKIVGLSDDLALAMAAVGVRIEAPIPGKSAIGIEIPNKETSMVTLRSLLDSPGFRKNQSPLLAALGKDIPGNPIYCDLTKMPHLLIAGATGSGKSVCINSILISILCRATPDQVKLLMIDPKVVELSIYNGIPHLLAPVVTDPKKAANTLNWAVGEMSKRYGLFAEASVRDFRGFNEERKKKREEELPLILIVIDELADLMQVASKEVEESISRLTAMARAAGIHLLIATQRPSVDVITGVIKANIPSRIAFAVSSQVDSRTILDMVGAEKLLGKGDMLYYPQSAAKPQRGQGAFVSDGEVESVIEFLKAQGIDAYDPVEAEQILAASAQGTASSDAGGLGGDELLPQAVEIVIQAGYASASILQRRMNIGYPRAARLIDQMYEKGFIGAFEGSKPRKLLISQSEWLEIKAKGDSHDS